MLSGLPHNPDTQDKLNISNLDKKNRPTQDSFV